MANQPAKRALFILLLLVGAGVIGLGAFWLTNRFVTQEAANISSFTECEAAGYPVMESHPRRCNTPGGKTFVEDIEGEEDNGIEMAEYASTKGETIRLFSPQSGDVITSPLSISGEVRGNWSFEADFPIEIWDWQGNVVASGIGTLTDDWMTDEYVLFESTIEFDDADLDGQGMLVLHKDNPSDLEEHDDRLEIPILFNN